MSITKDPKNSRTVSDPGHKIFEIKTGDSNGTNRLTAPNSSRKGCLGRGKESGGQT